MVPGLCHLVDLNRRHQEVFQHGIRGGITLANKPKAVVSSLVQDLDVRRADVRAPEHRRPSSPDLL